MVKSKITFIINPISGTANKKSIPELIDKQLDTDKYDAEILFTEYAGHAEMLASKAKDESVDIVVAVGGDGTINEVARGLINSKTALAIIPCGSGNGLARHLMLPLNVKGAIDVINSGVIHELDYGVIDGHPFFCTCGMGFDAFISAKFAEAGKRGPITYIENVLKEGLTYKPETYDVTFDEGKASYKAFLITCANASQYGNDAYIAPGASMSDGLLDVVIMEPFDFIDAPQISIEMFNKTLDKNSKIKSFKTKKLHIHRTKPGVIHYDGDALEGAQDLDISIVPKGIRVVVNPNADKRKRMPNKVQNVFSEFFRDLNIVRSEVGHPVRHAKAINNFLQNKLK